MEQDAGVPSEHLAAQTWLLKGKDALPLWYLPLGASVGISGQKTDPLGGL